MCDTPILIKNTNKGLQKIGYFKYKDCESAYIEVPCKHCPSCIANRQAEVVQRLQTEEEENHLFFSTLTYNNRSLPKLKTSTGYEIAYADTKDVTNMVKRLRANNRLKRKIRYYGVSELGSRGGRPHFHIIWIIEKYPKDNEYDIMQIEDTLKTWILEEWRRNYGSKRKPIYRSLCDYYERWSYGKLKSTYDLHYIDKYKSDGGEADVTYYITKYMLKHNTRETRLQQALKLNLPEQEYKDTWNTVKSKHFESENFGRLYKQDRVKKGEKKEFNECTLKKIRDGLQNTNFEYPVFYNHTTGKTSPLGRYYRRAMEIKDYEYYYQKRKYNTESNVKYTEHKTKIEIETAQRKLKDKQKTTELYDFTTNL